MPHFYCKLVAPRPTFPMDITADELALMSRHAAYWQAQLGGSVLLYGPVMDPRGPFGLGITEFAEEAEARAFTDADPVIAARRGFAYEIYPMQASTQHASAQ